MLCAAARYISVIVLLPSKRPGVHLADSLHTCCAQAIDYQEHSLMQSSAAFHCSVCVAQLLWDYSRDVAFLRAVFLAAQPRTGPSSTVLVTDVPGLAYGTPTQRVRAWVWGGDWGWWWVVGGGLAAAALPDVSSTEVAFTGITRMGCTPRSACCICLTDRVTWQPNTHCQSATPVLLYADTC